MKLGKIVLGVYLVAGVSLVSFGQDKAKPTSEQRAEKVTLKMATALELDENQSEKLEIINKNYFDKVKAVRENESLSEEDKKSSLKNARKERKDELAEVLSEEQMATLKEHKGSRHEKHKANLSNDFSGDKKPSLEERAKRKTAHLKEELDLTEEQETQVEALTLKVAKKIQAVKTDENIAKDKKKDFIEGNFEDYKRSMKSILTEEQFTKFEEMVEKHQAKKLEKKAKVEEEQSKD